MLRTRIDLKTFRHIPYTKRTHCAVCGARMEEPLIRLPAFPLTEIYTDRLIKERIGFVDQAFHLCTRCGHGQIANVIDAGLQYGDPGRYYFRASGSATGRESAEYFLGFLNRVTRGRRFGSVLEIGCNDLYVLTALRSRARRLIGIDPILKGKEKQLSKANIFAIGDFFENVTLQDKADLVICKDTLEHLSDPRGMVARIVDASHDGTLFFFQFPLLETLVSGYRFDHIFHQHLNYFSFSSITKMLDRAGCALVDWTINCNHWGAVIIAFRKARKKAKRLHDTKPLSGSAIIKRYRTFTSAMEVTRRQLQSASEDRETVYGYGAALMLPVLDYHLQGGLAYLECIIDDDKHKNGLYYINLPVAIRSSEKIADIRDSIILVTAIASVSNVRNILMKLFKRKPKRIILPLNNVL